MKIGIVDYGCGNISNVIKSLNKIGAKCGIIEKKEDLIDFEKIILPGMGCPSTAIKVLKKKKLNTYIKKFNDNSNPILGICLGFQLALQNYELTNNHQIKCLSLIKGTVKRLNFEKIPLPIINWLKVKNIRKKKDLHNKEFYFAHQYYCDLNDNIKNISFVELNNKKIISSYEKKNLYFYQFHPELSGDNGLNLLKKFKEI